MLQPYDSILVWEPNDIKMQRVFHYDPAAGTLTVPVTGLYSMNFAVPVDPNTLPPGTNLLTTGVRVHDGASAFAGLDA